MPFCMECGKKLPDGAMFCSECGTKQVNFTVINSQPQSQPQKSPSAAVIANNTQPEIQLHNEPAADNINTDKLQQENQISVLPMPKPSASNGIKPVAVEPVKTFDEEHSPAATFLTVNEPPISAEEIKINTINFSDVNSDVDVKRENPTEQQTANVNNEVNTASTENKPHEQIRIERVGSQEYDFKEPISIFRQRDFSYVFDKEDIEKNRVISALCYIPPFFFILLAFKSKSRFCLFHANQSLLLTITTALWTLLNSIIGTIISSNFVVVTTWGYSTLSAAGYALTCLIWGLQLIVTLTWFYLGLIDTMNGRAKKLPLIGRINLIFK